MKQGFYLATSRTAWSATRRWGRVGGSLRTSWVRAASVSTEPWGVSVSRNITSSKTKGIGGWTDDEIKRAITQGVSKDGSKLAPPIGYGYYATVSAADLDAIVAYLRTVPPKSSPIALCTPLRVSLLMARSRRVRLLSRRPLLG